MRYNEPMRDYTVLKNTIENHYLDTGEWLSIVKVKEKGRKVNEPAGTETAKAILKELKKKYKAAKTQEMNAAAALLGMDAVELSAKIRNLAEYKDISRMTKEELKVATCALTPRQYSDLDKVHRDELREIVREHRKRKRTEIFLRQILSEHRSLKTSESTEDNQ